MIGQLLAYVSTDILASVCSLVELLLSVVERL